MTVRTRADLASLPAYVPGKSIPGAIKLASNEVSAGPLPSVVKAIADAATGINRYPDSACVELTGRLADKLGVPADHLALGCGSVTLCQQLVQATCTENDEVLFAWRSFEAYPIVVHVAGAKQIRVPLTSGHVHDLDAMAAAITPNTRMVFVCNPNNPTGTALRTEEIEAFIDRVPSDVLVVIDEAYKEFVDDAHIPDGVELAKQQWAAGRDNVAVLRTFSKAYGLAGLRIGYAVAPPAVAEALRKVYVPFSRERAGAGGRDGLAGRRGRADGPLPRDRGGADPGARRAALDGLRGAGDPGELRVAAAGRAHGRVQRALPGAQGRRAGVRRRGHPRDDRRAGGERRLPGRRSGFHFMSS